MQRELAAAAVDEAGEDVDPGRPSGSQARDGAEAGRGSAGVVIGATSSSLPNMNWFGTS